MALQIFFYVGRREEQYYDLLVCALKHVLTANKIINSFYHLLEYFISRRNVSRTFHILAKSEAKIRR